MIMNFTAGIPFGRRGRTGRYPHVEQPCRIRYLARRFFAVVRATPSPLVDVVLVPATEADKPAGRANDGQANPGAI
jgi:hypothetical protein